MTVDELRAIVCDVLGISDATWIAAVVRATGESVDEIISNLQRVSLGDSDAGPVELPALTSFQAGRILSGEGRMLRIGDWIVRSEIGKGSFGTTYVVFRRGNGLSVLKQLHEGLDDTQKRRLRKEFETLQQLNHRGLPAALELAEQAPRPYFVMSLVEGLNGRRLVEKFANQNRLCPVLTTVALCRELCQVVSYVHSEGLVHRDLTPSNFLLRNDGGVALVDFGLVRCLYEGPEATQLTVGPIGTPAFLAPEQIATPHEVDNRADLYSLGCTLFFLLTGVPPFQGEILEVLDAQRNAPRPRVERIRDEVPEWLCQLVFRLMAIKKEDRPQSANDVLVAIQGANASRINILDSLEPTCVLPTVELGIPFVSVRPIVSNSQLAQSGRPTLILHETSQAEMTLIEGGVMEYRGQVAQSILGLRDFFMDLHPVTNKQFQAFVEKSRYTPIGDWRQHFKTNGDLLRPVRDVTFEDAVKYADSHGKALPTEAQWIYAATSKGKQSYPWPNAIGNERRADYGLTPQTNVTAVPPPVGQFLPNELGIYETAGSIRQWTLDWFTDLPFEVEKGKPRSILLNPCFLKSGIARVTCGGAWCESEAGLTLWHRSSLRPRESSPLVGFRCVWNPTSDSTLESGSALEDGSARQ